MFPGNLLLANLNKHVCPCMEATTKYCEKNEVQVELVTLTQARDNHIQSPAEPFLVSEIQHKTVHF